MGRLSSLAIIEKLSGIRFMERDSTKGKRTKNLSFSGGINTTIFWQVDRSALYWNISGSPPLFFSNQCLICCSEKKRIKNQRIFLAKTEDDILCNIEKSILPPEALTELLGVALEWQKHLGS